MQAIFDDSLILSFFEVVEESVLEMINGNGLPKFQGTLRDGMNNIAATIQQRLMEMIDNELRDNVSLRKGWVIERKNDTKTITSPFGPVTYQRTYFRNKKTNQYAYLADRIVGYTPGQRLDTLLEADLLEEAVDKSYAKAGDSQERRVRGTGVTSQTVLNIVRRLQPEGLELDKEPVVKRESRILYIEADEDHVAHQAEGIRSFEQRLVYVHEGSVSVGKKRQKLLGKKYFTFMPGTKTEEIWNTVWHYLDDTYNLEKTEHIFISGDGASWIKAGAEYIPDCRYVMDGFHLRKAIFRAAGADNDNRKVLTQAIWDGKWTKMNQLLISFREEAEHDSRKEAILDAQKYLNNNWPGIQARRNYQRLLVGCSAEGHVSHVLSARLSSRPMGWSYLGANQMAHLRVHQANGVNLHKTHIEQSTKKKQKFIHNYLPKQTVSSIAKAVGSSLETHGNIPSLKSGTKSFAPLLRRIAHWTFDI